MSWTTVAATSKTWTGATAASKTWSGRTVARTPPPWALLGSRVSSDDGVDFALRILDSGGFSISSDRAVVIREYGDRP